MREAVVERGRWLAAMTMGHLEFQAAGRLADSGLAHGGFARAEAHFASAIERMRRAGDGSTLSFFGRTMLGRCRGRRLDWPGAIEVYRAIGEDLDLPLLDRLCGTAYVRLGDLPRAAERYAAYARAVGYRRAFFSEEVSLAFQTTPEHRRYWALFLPALARASEGRRWDLEVASIRALYALRAGDPKEFARARRDADRLYEAAYPIQPFEAVAAYARIWQWIDRPRSIAVMTRYLGDHPDHGDARASLELLLQ